MSNSTKTAIDQAWNDIEPKLYAWVVGGGILTVAAYVGSLYNFTLPSWATGLIVLAGGTLAGYIKKSVIKSVVPADQVATFNIPTVTQPASEPSTPDAPVVPFDSIINPPAPASAPTVDAVPDAAAPVISVAPVTAPVVPETPAAPVLPPEVRAAAQTLTDYVSTLA